MNDYMMINVNGFIFHFGFNSSADGFGVFVDFEDGMVKGAIKNNDSKFFSSLQSLLSNSEELHAVYTMSIFEDHYTGHCGWGRLRDVYSFEDLENFKLQAQITLKSPIASEQAKKNSEKLIEELYKKYSPPAPKERTPEEEAKYVFGKNRGKIRLKIALRDGYKCFNCDHNKEDSLCIVQKDVDPFNYDLDNLFFRCRKCMRKYKNK